MELVDIFRGAQDAMDRGDYRLAAAASTHVLDTFPSCLTAHRMLGEAYLELGEIDSAIKHFARAIEIDPLNVVARLGLGVASEEKKDMSGAYTAYLHAWESNPALDQVRDELVRLRGFLGGEERLHPTRAGLAGIYARSGQFGRAAAEWRAVLMQEPESQRALTSLAEVLWRSGDDAAAGTACREVLRTCPDNARAVGMLADIETRRGNPAAAEMVDYYQFVDPAGEVMTLFAEWRDELDLSYLRRESALVADFDFSETPVQDRAPVATAVGVAASPGPGASQFGAPDLWDTLIRDMAPGDQAASSSTAVDDEVQPFSWLDDAVQPDPVSSDDTARDGIVDLKIGGFPDLPAAEAKQVTAPAAADAFDALLSEVAAMDVAAGTNQPLPGAATAGAERQLAPDQSIGRTPPAKRPGDEFVTADGRVDLTVGWDDLDRELREATPDFQNAHEIDALAAQLGVAGFEPFDAGGSQFDESAWAPFTDDDSGAPAQVGSATAARDVDPAVVVPRSFAPSGQPAAREQAVESGWDVDDELVSAIPVPGASGYTELLRHVDIELPLALESEEFVDPFANPDSAGTPLEFEDLLAVTSSDGTSPLTEPPGDVVVSIDPRQEQHSAFDVTGPWDPGSSGLPVDQGSLDLEEMLRFGSVAAASGAGWVMDQSPSAAFPEVLGESREPLGFHDGATNLHGALEVEKDPSLDAVLAELGDVEPFSLDDAVLGARSAASSDAVDFSDINEAPFDPALLQRVIVPQAPEPVGDPVTWKSAPVPIEQDEDIVSAWDDIQAMPAEVQPEPPVEPDPGRGGANGLGLTPDRVAWPAFVNHTSVLIDRAGTSANLFERLRHGKHTASGLGLTRVDRSLDGLNARLVPGTDPEPEPAMALAEPAAADRRHDPGPAMMSENERLDLMAMRVQLIEDGDSAPEVARLLEAAVGRGLADPLAMRVLGEAYLKLGRTEQAAAQFRQAMLARSRSR